MRIFSFITISIFTLLLTWFGSCHSHSENEINNELKSADTTSIIDSTVHTVKVKPIGNLRTTFNDLNDVHLQAATTIGIEPITDIRSAQAISSPIVKIQTCEEYHLDTLTYSLPYLIPSASKLLSEIGKRFTDTIFARSGNRYKIKVTSVLRTESSVQKLRRRNKNATDTSAHQFGTTFDISYVKFIQCNPNYIISQESLKNVLGEVLFDLRNSERCFVKYEVRQGCFHITTRK